MADKEVIQEMLEKVHRGTESRNDLIEVFTAMATELGVERKAPEPAPAPEPVDDEPLDEPIDEISDPEPPVAGGWG